MHRKNIDDCPRRAAAAKVIDEPLHEEERRPCIGPADPLPIGDIRFGERPTVGQGGGVDQRVDAAKLRKRVIEHAIRRRRVDKIGGDEGAFRALPFDRGDGGLPRSASRPVTSTASAPARATARAMAKPMPCVEPVTMAARPFTRAPPP